jgi:sulfate permease, SulP family
MPESISFAVVAGLDPLIGVLTASTMAVSISILGGRPAMISGAAGSVALVIAPLAHHHGLTYLVAAVLLGGTIQLMLGLCGADRLMRFLPRSVIVGFVNALAVLILLTQLPNLTSVPWPVYPLVAAGLLIIFGASRIVRSIPAPLLAIMVLTTVVSTAGIRVPSLGQKGNLAHWTLPYVAAPGVPRTFVTLGVIFPYALAIAVVGLLESLMTAQLVDEMTRTTSSKRRECCGQGLANILTAFCGGMGGCAMIGQTMINVKSGGRTRLSTFVAGASIFVFVELVKNELGRVPMAALAAVMIVIAFTTFDWASIRPATLRGLPIYDTVATTATVAATVATRDLAIGVFAGTSMFAVVKWMVGSMRVRTKRAHDEITDRVSSR